MVLSKKNKRRVLFDISTSYAEFLRPRDRDESYFADILSKPIFKIFLFTIYPPIKIASVSFLRQE